MPRIVWAAPTGCPNPGETASEIDDLVAGSSLAPVALAIDPALLATHSDAGDGQPNTAHAAVRFGTATPAGDAALPGADSTLNCIVGNTLIAVSRLHCLGLAGTLPSSAGKTRIASMRFDCVHPAHVSQQREQIAQKNQQQLRSRLE